MSKWTSWIEHTGDESQEWDSEETIKIKLDSGAVVKGWIESLVGLGPFTHYKRLKSNVKAEKKAKEAALQKLSQLGQECDNKYTLDDLIDKIDGLKSDLENAVETAFSRGAYAWCLLNYPDMYEKFVAAETKPSEPEKVEKEITPQPIITREGDPYETRDGRKAIVGRTIGGFIFGSIGGETWAWGLDGTVGNDPMHPDSIIGPWRNLYKDGSGFYMSKARYATKQAADEGSYSRDRIGAVLLSHTDVKS